MTAEHTAPFFALTGIAADCENEIVYWPRRWEYAMAFRRGKSNTLRCAQEWDRWRAQHKEELAAIGLPPPLYSDETRWLDFLENGHLHCHEDPWTFEFGQLSSGQLAALHRFLESEYGHADRHPPLLDWVRVRLGHSDPT